MNKVKYGGKTYVKSIDLPKKHASNKITYWPSSDQPII